ncbi:hypothetical protein JQ631_26815 [Bradyrhizobium manausense]|uniref:hypothetical protein n=1 Tax=Bradyrhizobium manausense TaxID=989370 RepID=UPI001BA4923D|nr:hypothetical protein [Bradyrhizobium manausense]MBR0792702.1 hypothetical protein [Bradyrhizobium manausense]
MPTVKQFERHLVAAGFPGARVRNTAASLIGGQVLPLSEKRGPAPEKLKPKHVADWGIALCLNEPLRNLANATQNYSTLKSPDGDRAGDAIAAILENFGKAKSQIQDGVKDSRSLRVAAREMNKRVVIDTSFPSITIATETPNGVKETRYGPIQDQPSSFIRVLHTCTISGHTLAHLAKALYDDATA